MCPRSPGPRRTLQSAASGRGPPPWRTWCPLRALDVEVVSTALWEPLASPCVAFSPPATPSQMPTATATTTTMPTAMETKRRRLRDFAASRCRAMPSYSVMPRQGRARRRSRSPPQRDSPYHTRDSSCPKPSRALTPPHQIAHRHHTLLRHGLGLRHEAPRRPHGRCLSAILRFRFRSP